MTTGCVSPDPGEETHGHGAGGVLQYPVVPNATEGELRDLRDVAAGECLNDFVRVGGRVRVLACTSPHRFEVVLTTSVAIPARASGKDAARLAGSACEDGIRNSAIGAVWAPERFMLEAVETSGHTVGPTSFLCAIGRIDLAQVTGSLRSTIGPS